MTSTLLFVYGTLRKGYSKHSTLQAIPHEFVANDRIRGDVYPTSLGFPCLMEGLGLVDGEVYRISESSLPYFDKFEGAPDFYERRQVKTFDNRTVWVYWGTGVQQFIASQQ